MAEGINKSREMDYRALRFPIFISIALKIYTGNVESCTKKCIKCVYTRG
jgi:hypothetical protein